MTKIFIGGAAEAADEAAILSAWLRGNGVSEIILDRALLADSLDRALAALAACDAVVLLASPAGREKSSFRAEASAAYMAGLPILLVAWPGLDPSEALPSPVRAGALIEAPRNGLSASALETLRGFLESLASKGTAGEDALMEDLDLDDLDLEEGAPASHDEVVIPSIRVAERPGADVELDFDIVGGDESEAAAAPASGPSPEAQSDAGAGGAAIEGQAGRDAGPDETRSTAPDAAAASTRESEPEPEPAAKASRSAGEPPALAPGDISAPNDGPALPKAPPMPAPAGIPAPSGAGSAGQVTPPSLDIAAMLRRAPSVPPTLTGAGAGGFGAARVADPRRRGPLNAADAERHTREGAARSGSGSFIATAVVLAAAAAAAYIFGPRFLEWLGVGLGAATAVPAGDPIQPQGGDRVEASVFAPPSVARGDVARVQVFLSKREQREEARAIAVEQDPSAGRRVGRPLSAGLQRGAEVEIALVAVDQAGRQAFVIDIQSEPLVWDGEPVSVDFYVEAREEAALRHHRLAAMVLRDGKPIGELRFVLEVTEAETAALGAAGKPQPVENEVETYRNLFFSYAREDLDKVRLVARSYRMLEQEFFWDVDDLEPGQEWERELKRRIDAADVFILFWSDAARRSEWVRREVEMALAREAMTGKPRFMPFPLDGPPPAEPWESIAERHIGDPLYYRAARAAQKNFEIAQER